MKPEQRHNPQSGFALVITLSLLVLLVLAVLALSALTKVNSQISSASQQQTQARQNALLAMNVALGELQKHAGADSQITAMAGITGLAANLNNTTRHWCGVWGSGGNFVAWLSSGAVTTPTAAIQNGLGRIALVGAGSVGATAANSEHVEVGKLVLNVVDPLTGQSRMEGNYAYWVGDEGVKMSAYAPDAELALPGIRPVLASTPAVSLTLKNSLATWHARLPGVVSYEQLRLLPAPGSPLTNSTIWDNFHHVTLTHYRLMPQGLGVSRRTGTFNINTNSVIAWRGLLETYNTTAPGPVIAATAMGASTTTSLPGRLSTGLPAALATGKSASGPFTSVNSFSTSALLSTALTASNSGVTPAQLIAGLGPMLTTRSDSFRIRAYGDAVNPADATRTEATAWCEAIVQRTTDPAPNGLGRKFVITYFRWLGPDDI